MSGFSEPPTDRFGPRLDEQIDRLASLVDKRAAYQQQRPSQDHLQIALAPVGMQQRLRWGIQLLAIAAPFVVLLVCLLSLLPSMGWQAIAAPLSVFVGWTLIGSQQQQRTVPIMNWQHIAELQLVLLSLVGVLAAAVLYADAMLGHPITVLAVLFIGVGLHCWSWWDMIRQVTTEPIQVGVASAHLGGLVLMTVGLSL